MVLHCFSLRLVERLISKKKTKLRANAKFMCQHSKKNWSELYPWFKANVHDRREAIWIFQAEKKLMSEETHKYLKHNFCRLLSISLIHSAYHVTQLWSLDGKRKNRLPVYVYAILTVQGKSYARFAKQQSLMSTWTISI